MQGCISYTGRAWVQPMPPSTLAPFLCPQTKKSGWTVNVWSGRDVCASGCSQASPLVERPFRNARGGPVEEGCSQVHRVS